VILTAIGVFALGVAIDRLRRARRAG
jgi:hypothetical protein